MVRRGRRDRRDSLEREQDMDGHGPLSGRLECVRGAGRGVLFEGGWVLEASGAGWGVCADWSLVQRALGNQSTRVPENRRSPHLGCSTSRSTSSQPDFTFGPARPLVQAGREGRTGHGGRDGTWDDHFCETASISAVW